MLQIHTTKNNRIIRASLEESIQRALTTHQDVKIPDGPIVIDKDLLQEIRDAFDNEAGDGNTYCKELRDKLDNLYPFLNQKIMEHFFLEDRFYGDLDDFINDLFPEDGDVEALPDDWSIRVQESKLEPMFQLTRPEVAHILLQHIGDIHEDRFSPDDDGRIDDEIKEFIKECFDVEKFNSLVPKLYYPAGFATITKQDLLDFLND